MLINIFMLEQLLLDIFPDRTLFMPVQDVEEAIQTLSPLSQRIIQLHYYQNYSVAQISEICDTPISHVRAQLFEVVGQLRRMLNPDYYIDTVRKYVSMYEDSFISA